MYTEVDLKGFTFQEMSIAEKTEIVNKLLRGDLIAAALCLAFSLLFSFLCYCSNFEFYLPFISLCIILFVIFISVYFGHLKMYKNNSMSSHFIKVTYKHDVEVRGTSKTGYVKFYPVTGCDAVSNYESICYLSKKTYKECKVGDTIELVKGSGRVPLSYVVI